MIRRLPTAFFALALGVAIPSPGCTDASPGGQPPVDAQPGSGGDRAAPEAAAERVAGSAAKGPGRAAAPPVEQVAFEQARNTAFRLLDERASPDECLAALQAAHALDPGAYGVNSRLGSLCVEMKRYAEAREHYEAALAARPDDAVSRREVVWLALQLGDPERALQAVAPLRDDPVLGGDALYLHALALDQLGRRDEARGVLADLDQHGSESAFVLRGQMALGAGELAAALADFEAVVARRPDDQAALRGLADTARREGDETAAAHWDEVLTLLVALRDNRYAKPAQDKVDRKVQRQAERASDYIAREVAAQEQRLRRLIEIHPAWAEGFELLAELLRKGDRREEGCAVVDALLARHGAAYDAAAVADLRRRFCPEGSR